MASKQIDSAPGGEKRKVSKTTTEDRSDKSSDCCGRCTKLVRNDDKALLCDICETWYHVKCERIPDEVYKFMSEEEAGSQFT